MKAIPTLCLLIAATTATAADPPPSSAPAQAKVSAPVKEADLATVTLTPQAEQRLGIKLAAVEKRTVPVARLFAGELVIPLTEAGAKTGGPVLGGTLDEFLKLADLQSAADGRSQQARVQHEAARIALDRAQKIFSADAGSVRSVDEAKAQMQLAEAALATAEEQRALLGKPVMQAVVAPQLWVRVAVFAGEMPTLDPAASASVRPIAGDEKSALTAKPVAGPRTANATAATVDVYYDLGGAPQHLRAGERVSVAIPTTTSADSLVVPHASVLIDIHGGQWVYENTAPQTFVRRRVQVARVIGSDAVLASGPAVGAKIVTDGAAELFGVEFGAGK